jgi:uncharacterized protein with NRDE domain
VCLLIVLSRTRPEAPLIVAANRDERYDRPAVPMAVLADSDPRVLGGRDELAGGTWLAVNEHGVVAGLTNRPVEGGRDPAKRSRGELPLAAARHRSAEEAAAALAGEVDPTSYNPAWMLVGDKRSLFFVDIAGSTRVHVEELPPGLHILENSAPDVDSPKVRHVRARLTGVAEVPAEELSARLVAVVNDHVVPDLEDRAQAEDASAPPPVRAACVHTEAYGTRWSCLVTVGADRGGPPLVRYADGPPCRTEFVDASGLWTPAGA